MRLQCIRFHLPGYWFLELLHWCLAVSSATLAGQKSWVSWKSQLSSSRYTYITYYSLHTLYIVPYITSYFCIIHPKWSFLIHFIFGNNFWTFIVIFCYLFFTGCLVFIYFELFANVCLLGLGFILMIGINRVSLLSLHVLKDRSKSWFEAL